MENLTDTILGVELGVMMTLKSYDVISHLFIFTLNIIYRNRPDSQDNRDCATQLLLPVLRLVPKTQPAREEHSKTGTQDGVD